MKSLLAILITNTIWLSVSGLDSYEFPKDFIFGAATASYQIEGAWNIDGKGENIWDRLTHEHPDFIKDKSNGDTACNSYYKYKEDVQLLKGLGVNFYRFSLSWSRILPNGFSSSVNQKGIDYYNNVIDELIENGITPMITIYHWDLPQPLQDIGGWTNPKIVDYFTDFARVAFDNFADRVPIWITINEPNPICREGYGDNGKAPALESSGLAEYSCAYHLLKAHASVYHLFNNEYRSKLNGKLGFVMDVSYYYSHNNDDENDLQAQENALQFMIGLYLHPIFHSDGDYPQIVKSRIADRSNKEGFTKSRLPSLTSEEIHYIKGTADFLGVNHYTSYVAQYQDEPEPSEPNFEYDRGFSKYQKESWPETASDWFRVVPEGFKDLLVWLAKEYNNPEMIITENGYSDIDNINDDARMSYYQEYLSSMLEAIAEGVNVTGYTAWSLLDNFEWMGGYIERFGIYQVNFEDDDRPRTEKTSAKYYREVISKKCVVGKPNCESKYF